jgi:hypothetical protein
VFHIEKIDYSEIGLLLDIIRGKAIWLETINRPMWNISKINEIEIRKQYDNPDLFVAFENQDTVGCFLLNKFDKTFWPDCKKDNAYYFHKLVVRNEFSGKGYSGLILEWIKKYGKLNGKQYIRLDYDKTRVYLDKLYTSHGFYMIEEYDTIDGYHIKKSEYKIV